MVGPEEQPGVRVADSEMKELLHTDSVSFAGMPARGRRRREHGDAQRNGLFPEIAEDPTV